MRGEIFIVIWVAFVALIAFQRNVYREELVLGKLEMRCIPGFAFFAFLPLLLWVGFRSRYGYADTSAYVTMYNHMPQTIEGIKNYVSSLEKDWLFFIFMGVIKSVFGESYRPFFLIVALIQSISMINFYRKYSTNYVFSLFLFVISAEYLAWMMNGMRQFLAVAINYMAIPCLLEKKYFRFVLVILLASTIHQTALLMIPIALVAQGKPWNGKTLLFILGAVMSLAATNQFTAFLDVALEDTAYAANLIEMQGHAGVNPLRVMVYSVPAVLAFVGRKQIEKENDVILNVSVNMAIITMALYIVGMATSGIMFGRLPIYASLFNYILLPYEVNTLFRRDTSRILKIALVVLYLGYYYYLVHFAYGRI